MNLRDVNQVLITLAISTLIGVTTALWVNTYLEKGKETTDCSPPVNEWDKLVARLQRNEDGVLTLVCMHEEILHWGVR